MKIRPREIAIYYIGEIKNDSYFQSHVADSLFDRSNESFNPYEPVKKKKIRCSSQELQRFQEKSKWSVLLPRIFFSQEKNTIFAVTGSGVC